MANTKYKPEYCKGVIEFFRRMPFTQTFKEEYYQNGTLKSKTPIMTACEYPTFQEYADSLGVHIDTLSEWKKTYPEFAEAYKRAKVMQESILLKNGLQGLYNSQFAQFVGKNCFGYSDRNEMGRPQDQDSEPLDLDQLNERLRELTSAMSEEERRVLFGEARYTA